MGIAGEERPVSESVNVLIMNWHTEETLLVFLFFIVEKEESNKLNLTSWPKKRWLRRSDICPRGFVFVNEMSGGMRLGKKVNSGELRKDFHAGLPSSRNGVDSGGSDSDWKRLYWGRRVGLASVRPTIR